jgi:Pectate lyase superfamily protein
MMPSLKQAPRLKFGKVRSDSQVWIAVFWLLFLVTSVIADSQTYDVTKYGAIPNDGKNDTPSIWEAINEANNAGGGTVYFPQGIYDVNTFALTRSQKATESGATSLDQPLRHVNLVGDGSEGPHATILKRIQHQAARSKGRDQSKIAVVGAAQDVLIKDIAFDANGIQRFGGISFHGCKRITITHTRFFDSDPFTYSPKYDRYAYVFGYGGAGHEDLVIRNNRIEDLQLEVDFAKRVQIVGNTVMRSDFTAAIGSYGRYSDGMFEEVKIIGNTIIDAAGQAITVQLDFRPPKVVNNFRFRDIEIRDNIIIYTPKIRKAPGLVMRIGASNNSLATMGNVFENIRIEGNQIYVAPGTPPFSSPLIFGNTSAITGFKFVNVTLHNNTFYYDGNKRLIDIHGAPGDHMEQVGSGEQMGNRKLPYQPLPQGTLPIPGKLRQQQ